MPGEAHEPLYVAARRVLLDALAAVSVHLHAIVVVGAQAVYLRSGDRDLAVAPFTTDADLAIDPRRLGPEPLLEDLLARAGFGRDPGHIGTWTKAMLVGDVRQVIPVDLLVPDSLGGPGRRSARLPPHELGVARKVAGLEGMLVDNDAMSIGALDRSDPREFTVAVAGPGALLVAKTHKIVERLDRPDRRSDKDALDVLRLLRAVPTGEFAVRLQKLLADGRTSAVTARAVEAGLAVFGSPAAAGSQMAARAAAGVEPAEVIAASVATLMQELHAALRHEP